MSKFPVKNVAGAVSASKPPAFVPAVMHEPPAYAFQIRAEPTPEEKRARVRTIARSACVGTVTAPLTRAAAAAAAASASAAATAAHNTSALHAAANDAADAVAAAPTSVDAKSSGGGISSSTLKRPSKHGKRAAPDAASTAAGGSGTHTPHVDHELVMWNSIGELLFGVTHDDVDRLKSRVVAAAGAFSRAKLPGPLPVSLGREHLARLRTAKYWVAEKSDGVRAMLFVCSRRATGGKLEAIPGCYFIDRKFAFRRLRREYEELFMDAFGTIAPDCRLQTRAGLVWCGAVDRRIW
jgi:hypothetical protein